MIQNKSGIFKIIAGFLLAAGLFVFMMPGAVFSQQQTIQDMVVNGGFEGGFQDEFGVGYGWGGFSNGNAVVGWNGDDWQNVISDGDYSQRIEIKDALDQDRYAGIYQTISVVPGEQYKLTIKGMIRSEEGSVEESDYGYRLQFAIDYNGDTAWELLSGDAWQELPWDEQPLVLSQGASHRLQTFDTTITSKTDRMTLFIRGWKKWINNGAGVFNLDEISLVGPAPEGFQSPIAQLAAVSNETTEAAPQAEVSTAVEAEAVPAAPAQAESAPEQPQAEVQPELDVAAPVAENSPAAESQTTTALTTDDTVQQSRVTPLPTTGEGDNHSLIYIVMIGSLVLLSLFVSAITATIRRRSLVE